MRIRTKVVALACAVVTGASTLTGCGLNSSFALPLDIEPGTLPAHALDGVHLVVGSKDFTEEIILGHIAEFALAASGADIEDLTNIQGSNSARNALTNGDVDLYYDYTGTGWINYLGNTENIPDQQKQYEAMRDADAKNGLVWLDYSPLNDTYAFAMNSQVAAKLKITTISDMVEKINQDPGVGTFCLETEFASRNDGFPGVQKAYDFKVPSSNVKNFGTGAVYAATASGSCNFGEVFTTDGRIKALNLTVLDDDKHFFPQYNVAPVVRKPVLDAHPAIAEVFNRIAPKLTNAMMLDLAADVDVNGADPVTVARDWLVKEGFVKLPK
jgi:osmoprotectant transport system substrate-binding protein